MSIQPTSRSFDESDSPLPHSILLRTSIPGPQSQALILRREVSVPRSLSMIVPVFVSRAEGAVVEDVDGNRLLDFSGGIGCQNTGHRPPAVVAAIHRQVDRFLHTSFVAAPYEAYVELAEIMNRRAPGDFKKKTILLNSGAEAIENAVKIARAYTSRSAIIVFDDAFHGRTQLTMTMTGKTWPYKAGFGPPAPEIYRIPYAYCYRCPINRTYPSCEAACANLLESLFRCQVPANEVAAVVFEPVLGEGGFVTPPIEWFRRVTQLCREHGILLIADEIQTGFGRTGEIFASTRFGLEPDLLVTAKSIAAGLPLAAVTGRAEVMDAPGAGGLGSTLGGNPVACVAALAVWKTIDALDLRTRAEAIGRHFEAVTKDWRTRFPIVGELRGVGAMRAIELVRDAATREPATDLTKTILKACHRRGLLLHSAGAYGNVLRILVPLTVTDDQLQEGLEVIAAAIAEVTASLDLSNGSPHGLEQATQPDGFHAR